MTPLSNVFMLHYSEKVNRATLEKILASGHSRIPIYNGKKKINIVGMLLVKNLLNLNLDKEIRLGDLKLRRMTQVTSTMPLYNLLNIFQTGKSHMTVVIDNDSVQPIGIITLEDLIEELIQVDIHDETEKPKKKVVQDDEEKFVDHVGDDVMVELEEDK